MPELTRAERSRLAVKTAFRDFLIEGGYPPSRRQLAARAGLALTATQEAVDELVAAGALRRVNRGTLALPEREWRALLDAPGGSLSRGWASGSGA